jgi:hypothetical protein
MSEPNDQQPQQQGSQTFTRRTLLQGMALFGAIGTLGGESLFSTRDAHAGTISVSADFTTAIGPALDKSRFGVYNSGLVGLDRYQRDADKLLALQPDSLRFDGGLWGFNINQNLVQGIGNYNFSDADQLISLLNSRNVKPYWSYEYEPPPLQQNGDYKSPPNNLDNWARVLGDIASHFKSSGHPVGYHEIDTSSPCDHYPAAAQLLTDFSNFLNYPYLRLVNWAQFMDPGNGYEHIGLISVDGHLKAAYNGWLSLPACQLTDEQHPSVDHYGQWHPQMGKLPAWLLGTRAALIRRQPSR